MNPMMSKVASHALVALQPSRLIPLAPGSLRAMSSDSKGWNLKSVELCIKQLCEPHGGWMWESGFPKNLEYGLTAEGLHELHETHRRIMIVTHPETATACLLVAAKKDADGRIRANIETPANPPAERSTVTSVFLDDWLKTECHPKAYASYFDSSRLRGAVPPLKARANGASY